MQKKDNLRRKKDTIKPYNIRPNPKYIYPLIHWP